MKEWDENCSNAQDAEWGQDELEKMAGEPLIEVSGYFGGVNGGAGPGMNAQQAFLSSSSQVMILSAYDIDEDRDDENEVAEYLRDGIPGMFYV